MNNHTDSWLGEAFGSYQPSTLSPETWARFRTDVLDLVRRCNPTSWHTVRPMVSRLAVFLADVADTEPNATLAELLTPERIKGYLQRLERADVAATSRQNIQGSLNRLLLASHDLAVSSPRRKTEPRLTAYTQPEVRAVLAAAVGDGDPASLDLARTLTVGLAGGRIPTWRDTSPVELIVAGQDAEAGGAHWRFPAQVTLPPSGRVDAKTVTRGKAWGAGRFGFRLDVRRLRLRHLADRLEALPAREVIGMSGVGRDSLSAAVDACPPASAADLRTYLRAAGRQARKDQA